MTKRKIAHVLSKCSGYKAVAVEVDRICFEAQVRPYDIEEVSLEFGNVVLYLKGYWTVHGENIKVKLKGISHYIKTFSNLKRRFLESDL